MASFATVVVQPTFETVHEVLQVGLLQRRPDLLVGKLVEGIDVEPQRAGKQNRILK